MVDPFSNWFDGAVVTQAVATTGSFDFWFDGAPVIQSGSVVDAPRRRSWITFI